MKREVSLPMMIGVVVAIVLIIGFIGWWVFGSQQANGGAEKLKASQARKAKRDE